jgi:hypothetical protein
MLTTSKPLNSSHAKAFSMIGNGKRSKSSLGKLMFPKAKYARAIARCEERISNQSKQNMSPPGKY